MMVKYFNRIVSYNCFPTSSASCMRLIIDVRDLIKNIIHREYAANNVTNL